MITIKFYIQREENDLNYVGECTADSCIRRKVRNRFNLVIISNIKRKKSQFSLSLNPNNEYSLVIYDKDNSVYSINNQKLIQNKNSSLIFHEQKKIDQFLS